MTEEEFRSRDDTAKAHVEPLMQFFVGDQLLGEETMRSVVRKTFLDAADTIVSHLPRNPERTVALRKLLEARDCAMRASSCR